MPITPLKRSCAFGWTVFTFVAGLGLTAIPASASTSQSSSSEAPSTAESPLFNARIDAVDVASRSASVSGTAHADATITINGTHDVTADTNGSWTATVAGLAFGENSILVEEHVVRDGITVKANEQTLTATLAAVPLTATGSFEEDLSWSASVSGTAHPGATVEIRDTADTVIATTTADLTGDYSVPIPAPHKAGIYALAVNQVIVGERDGSTPVNLDYGAAVSITTPAPDTNHNGGPLTMSGRGEPGSKILVRRGGSGGRTLGSATVRASGDWNLITTYLDDSRTALEVVQSSRGANTTSNTVTINADNHTIDPLVIDQPIDGSIVYAPDNEVRFTGTAEPGARIVIKAGNGRTIVDATANADGAWYRSGTLTHQQYELTTEYTTPGTPMVPGTMTVTVDAGTPLEIVTPADGATVIAPDNMVTFTGTGTPGSDVRIVGEYSTPDIKTTVDDSGRWSATGFLEYQRHELEVTNSLNWWRETSNIHLTVEPSEPTIKPFALISPKNGDTVPTSSRNDVTFTGTGAAGATVEIINDKGGPWERIVATTTVRADGTWSATGFLNNNLRYRLWYAHTPGTHGGEAANGTFTITTKPVVKPFSLTSPKDGDLVVTRTGMVTFTGTGAVGSTVKIINDQGGPWERVVATATVSADNSWTATGGLNNNLTYPLWYSHTPGPNGGEAAGGSFTITTAPAKPPVKPFSLNAPKDGDTVVTATGMVAFTGTGAVGATVKIINDKGGPWERIVASTIVKPNGTWSTTGGLNNNLTYPLWYTLIPDTQDDEAADGTFTITTVPSVDFFTLTSPKDGDIVVTPTGMVTFTGTGTAGATVSITNDKGGPWERIVATAVVQPSGSWSATGGLNNNLTYPLGYTHTPSTDGGKTTHGTFTITTTPRPLNTCSEPAEVGGQFNDFTISDPQNPSASGAWYRFQGTPGTFLCVNSGSGPTTNPVSSNGTTALIYLPWGPHHIWQTRDGQRTRTTVFNTDCWSCN